jgi:hypothetical protein
MNEVEQLKKEIEELKQIIEIKSLSLHYTQKISDKY